MSMRTVSLAIGGPAPARRAADAALAAPSRRLAGPGPGEADDRATASVPRLEVGQVVVLALANAGVGSR